MAYSVIILSRNPNNLVQCVHAIRLLERRAEIIVVDDGARDAASKVLDGITWVDGEKPFVYARNINIGISAAGDDDVILLNDDALLLTRRGFTSLARAILRRSDIGILSAGIKGDVCNPNQHPQWPPTLRPAEELLAFICVYIPRTTIELIGLLDEQFTGYGEEDRDYCTRVMDNGLRLAIWDGCIVDHTGRLPSTWRAQPDWLERYRHNCALFQRKYPEHILEYFPSEEPK